MRSSSPSDRRWCQSSVGAMGTPEQEEALPRGRCECCWQLGHLGARGLWGAPPALAAPHSHAESARGREGVRPLGSGDGRLCRNEVILPRHPEHIKHRGAQVPLCPLSFFSFPLIILLFCPHTFALDAIAPSSSVARDPRRLPAEVLTVPPVFSPLFSRTPDLFIFFYLFIFFSFWFRVY